MKKTVSYTSVESITYKFNEHDIKEAVIKHNEIKGTHKYKTEMWFGDTDDDKTYLTITIHISKPIEEDVS